MWPTVRRDGPRYTSAGQFHGFRRDWAYQFRRRLLHVYDLLMSLLLVGAWLPARSLAEIPLVASRHQSLWDANLRGSAELERARPSTCRLWLHTHRLTL